MIMHGTWYKGPQLTHHSPHSDYHQFRSYPSFVVTPYSAAYDSAGLPPQIPGNSSFVEGSFAASVNHIPAANQLALLSPPIKVEQPFGTESTSLAVIGSDEFGPVLNVDCNSIENLFRKPTNAWSSNNAAAEGAHNDIIGNHNNNTSLLSPTATNTPTPPDSTAHLGLANNFEENRKHSPISSPTTKQREEQVNNCIKNNNHNNSSKSELLAHGFLQQCGSSSMPIGGVQSQNPSQGLVHWMSVMAEHMSGQSHHDPTPVGMHAYMWNGNVDVSKNFPSSE